MDNNENPVDVSQPSKNSINQNLQEEVSNDVQNTNLGKPKKNNKIIVLLVVISIVVVLGVLAFFFLYNKSDNSDNSSSGNGTNNDNTAELCVRDGIEYGAGESLKDEQNCEDCVCGGDGEFDCTVNQACQSAKDTEEFFKNKIFYVNTKGYEESMDESLSASKYEVYSFDVETKQKKQLTYMNKDKTLKDQYNYNILGISDNKEMVLLRRYRSGDDFKSDAVKLNIDTLKWEVLQNYKNAENSSKVTFLDDGFFSYLSFIPDGGSFEKSIMTVNNYNNAVNTELVNKKGFYMYGRGGALEDMSGLRYSPDRSMFMVKDTFYSYGEYNKGGISFGNPIWVYNKNGEEEISVDGTQPSWISNDEFVFVESEDISDATADVSLSVYDYKNSSSSELFQFDKFPYGVDALADKVLYWNFEGAGNGVTESETFVYDIDTKKTISLGVDFNQSKWLNENRVVMRKAIDCGEIYNTGNFNAECPAMYDGTTLIDRNSIWIYDLMTNKTTEHILNDEGDVVHEYYSFISFK